MSSRWFRFILAIVVGIAAGLLYGWVINPVKYVDTTPDTLRVDYKTDYVLMVAEAFQADGDLPQAIQRLDFLGGDRIPSSKVLQAITFAEQNGYTDADVALMQSLSTALQNQQIRETTPTP